MATLDLDGARTALLRVANLLRVSRAVRAYLTKITDCPRCTVCNACEKAHTKLAEEVRDAEAE